MEILGANEYLQINGNTWGQSDVCFNEYSQGHESFAI
jgi:hypothetical protein